ncbi:MAG: phosphoadenylyl-sulfate reductase [Spirochaetales bacterium]|nr:MAG: phosphoadenylyl-sulfate reductase [Spirochaetales bacterium]
MKREELERIDREYREKPPEELLAWAASAFKGRAVFASSLGLEDQVLTRMLADIDPAFPMFTLDTGRLFQETYDVLSTTREQLGVRLEILFPKREEVEAMVNEHGPNLFYESVEKRKLCCGVRKVAPLTRRLKGLSAWITGLRREQSVTRTDLKHVEWDEVNGLVKINPLADWHIDEVWAYIKKKSVPYNRLHAKGFPSIGCAPCTRAVKEGQDIRAGRWWWENPEYRECGLHER